MNQKRSTAHALMGFAVGTLCIVLAFAASAVAVPLYGLYAEGLGVERTSLTFVTVSYFAGTVTALLFFSRLSDYLGRKPVLVGALAVSVFGCLLLGQVESMAQLCLGRFLHGIACGVTMGTAGAYVMDNALGLPLWAPSAVNTSGSQLGFAVGSFTAAGVAGVGLGMSLGFYSVVVLEVGCVLLLAVSPETASCRPGVVRAIRPQVMMPPAVRVVLPVCCCAWMAAWGIGGYYQTFSFLLGQACFYDNSILYAALAFALYMFVGMFGSMFSGRFEPLTSQRVGMVGIVVSFCALIAAIQLGSPLLLLIACVVGGNAHGLAYAGALRRATVRTKPDERAGTLSAITLLSYAGAAVPNLVVGTVGAGADLMTISLGYLIFVCVACVGSFLPFRSQE